MTNDEITESLLEKICYVIDILPSQMADFDKYSDIEEYYLQEKELEKFAEKIVNIVIKIQGIMSLISSMGHGSTLLYRENWLD